jgi:hypothetical protein
VTDYFAQGMTFPAEQTWLADFQVPEDGKLKKETGYVITTRYKSYRHLHSLTPLLDGNRRTRSRDVRSTPIYKKYKQVLQKQNLDRVAEFARLNDLAAATRTRLAPVYALIEERNAALRPPDGEMADR